LCLVRPDKMDVLLAAAFEVVDKHIGVVSVSDAQVIRADRF
ncbi:MAG: transcriptional regulator, partial [Pseudomonadota bacterium]